MIGKKIGAYKIKRKLGEGGMGSVWLATHTYLGQDRAIKLLSDRLVGSKEAKRRFLKEATEAVKLQHEGIATVFDAGEENGSLFIAFEYIDGQTVADMVRETGFHIGPAVRVAREVAEALEHAHSKNIVHRDVTARNVMVNRDGKAILVDFGLVLNVEASRFSLTGGSIMGTVAYMSPEVVQEKRADHRSDIYGLGVVLYEMLTRRLPFTGEREATVLLKVIQGEAESIEKHLPGIPKGLVSVVEKAMNKDPEKRFASAQEMADELREYETVPDPVTVPVDPPPEPPEPSIWRQIMAWPVRNAKMVAGSILLAALLALFALYWLEPPWSPVKTIVDKIIHPDVLPYTSVAVMPVKIESTKFGAPDMNHIAYAMGEAMSRKLKGISGLRVTPWETSIQMNSEKDLPRVICEELGVEALLITNLTKSGQTLEFSVSLIRKGDITLSWADSFHKLETDFLSLQNQVALAIAEEIKPDLSQKEKDVITAHPTRNPAAYDLYIRGSYDNVLSDDPVRIDRALGLFEQAASLDTAFADAYVGIGTVHRRRYYAGREGEEGLRTAETNLQKALALKPGHLRALRELILVHWHRGENEACLSIGEGIRSLSNDEDPEHLLIRGLAYFLGGLPDRAGPIFQRIQEIDPMNRLARGYQVIAHAWAGEFEKAIEIANSYLSNFEEVDDVHLWAAASYHMLGELGKAERHYRAVELGVNSNPYIYFFLFDLYDRLERPEEARQLCRDGLKHLERLYQYDQDNLRLQSALFGMYAFLGDRDAMEGILEDLRLDSTVNGSALWFPAIGHARLGDHDRAVELMRGMVELGASSQFMINLQGILGLETLQSLPDYQDFLREFRAREADLLSRHGEVAGLES